MGRPPLPDSIRRARSRLGSRLRHEREAAGLSRSQLATFVDLAEIDVERIESGQKSLPAELLPDLCYALGITVSRFLGEQPRAAMAGVA